jgi:hypothetical protein
MVILVVLFPEDITPKKGNCQEALFYPMVFIAFFI